VDHVLRRLGHEEGADVVLVFISSLCVRMEYLVRLHLLASNNVAEYEVLINGLRIAVESGFVFLRSGEILS
jgi:ribonuclease HI